MEITRISLITEIQNRLQIIYPGRKTYLYTIAFNLMFFPCDHDATIDDYERELFSTVGRWLTHDNQNVLK